MKEKVMNEIGNIRTEFIESHNDKNNTVFIYDLEDNGYLDDMIRIAYNNDVVYKLVDDGIVLYFNGVK